MSETTSEIAVLRAALAAAEARASAAEALVVQSKGFTPMWVSSQ